jgi:hypothetical protein
LEKSRRRQQRKTKRRGFSTVGEATPTYVGKFLDHDNAKSGI